MHLLAYSREGEGVEGRPGEERHLKGGGQERKKKDNGVHVM